MTLSDAQAPGGLEVELGPVAGLGRPRPPHDRHDLSDRGARARPVRIRERELLFAVALRDLLARLEAEVVGPALQHREAERPVEVLGEEGQVLAGQLVLQRLRGGGDDDVPRRARRDQVGDDLPVPVPACTTRCCSPGWRADGVGHLPLTGPVLAAAGQRGRDLRQRFGDLVEGHVVAGRHPGR